MRLLSILGLASALLLSPLHARAQDELTSVATLHLADGSTVALVQWKLTYEIGRASCRERVYSSV